MGTQLIETALSSKYSVSDGSCYMRLLLRPQPALNSGLNYGIPGRWGALGSGRLAGSFRSEGV